jgi:hypothetical protein
MGEGGEQRAKRIAKVRKVTRRFFKAVVRELGEDEARKLFRALGVRPKGRPERSMSLGRHRANVELMRIYEEEVYICADEKSESIPRKLAQRLNDERRHEFGNSAEAIERQIRRLLAKRRQQSQKSALQGRRRRPDIKSRI